MGTDGHGFTEFLAADMIHPEGEARKECFHPCLSGLIRGSILWLFRCGCCLSCGFTFGVLKGASELIQFMVRHAKSQSCVTPLGDGAINAAQNLIRLEPWNAEIWQN